ncbi:MAG: PEGA domain-containing protein [Polyangiaceae bacterium]|nr:PEGA domain-containing protein [Polyangiaceae bacterium]
MSRARLRLGAAALLLALAAPGRAEPSPAALAQARTYFRIGARAFAAGQFEASLEAFERAYEIAPRDGLVFSLAQAHRKLFLLRGDRTQLARALARYREYLERAPAGPRAAEAREALLQLTPLADAGPPAGGAEAAPPRSAQRTPTRLMVSSAVPDAALELDGRAVGKLPLTAEVSPGRHRIVLRAPGHLPWERRVSVPESTTVPIDAELRPRPGYVEVRAPRGSRVAIDGREVGVAPLAPVPVQAGSRTIAVRANGREPFVRRVKVPRGGTTRVSVALETTTQRVVAVALGGAALGATATTAVLGLAAVRKQDDAEAMLARRGRDPLGEGALADYEALREDRDAYRAGAYGAAGAAAALGVIGAALWFFDEPPPARVESSPGAGAPAGAPVLELGLAPGGVAARGRF